MRRFVVFAAAALALAFGARPAAAQVFGQYSGARPLDVNAHELGGFVEFSDNVLGLLGQLRLSFHPGVDFGFQGGLGRYGEAAGDLTTARLGTDFKYLALGTESGSPVDLAIGAGIGFEMGDGLGVLSLGPSVVVSRPVLVGGQPRLVPYAAAAVLFSHVDQDPGDSNDLAAPIRVGTELEMAPGLRGVAELRFVLGDAFQEDVALSVGLRTRF